MKFVHFTFAENAHTGQKKMDSSVEIVATYNYDINIKYYAPALVY